MSGLTEVLAAHQDCVAGKNLGYYRTEYTCECGDTFWAGVHDEDPNFAEANAAHQADMLTAAGFGPVKEAQAAALREAADELARLPYVKPGAPGRGQYERILAVRRGDTDAWLKGRASILEASADPEGLALVQAIHDRKAAHGG